ncbi:MAG: hypothetical protein V1899_09585 [Planctomycetota bacterium]
MNKQVSNTRALLMGLLFAMVGFSFALATSSGLDVLTADGVVSRGVGSSTIMFTNPLVSAMASPAPVSGERDLGDVALGSSLVRYARATGGVRPYTFTSTVSPTLTSVITGSTATLKLFTNGMLSGSLGNIAITKSPLQFKITVAEAKGSNANSATEMFRLTLDNSGTFKFAIDALCSGVQYQPYLDVFQVMNGSGTFSATNITVNGTAKSALEDAGLSIGAADGTVFGKPTVAGTVVFTANCVDAKGNKAKSRNGLTDGQVITLPVSSNSTIVSDIVTTGCAIKVGVAGKDSIKYAAVANLAGNKPSSLAGKKLVLRIGGYTTPDTTATPASLDDKGKVVKAPKPAKGTKPVKLAGCVSMKGGVKIAVSNETLTGKFGTISGTTKLLAVQLQIGEVVTGSEILLFTVKSSSKGATLTYKFCAANNPGGTFMVTSVAGKDDKTTDADAWKVAFIATAPSANSFTGANKAAISIGSSFTDSLTCVENKGKVKSTDKRNSKDAKVTKLAMNGVKGKGAMQTGILPYSATGIHKGSTAGLAATGNTFPMNVGLSSSIKSLYFGEGAMAIFKGTKGNWSSKLPK